MNERLTIISNAIYDDAFINRVRPNYQNYLDGQSKIPYYIHAGGDYEYVGFTDYLVKKLEKTLDISLYKEFIVNIFNRIDNLIDIDFELWDHNNGSLIDIYAIEYVPYDPVIGTAYLWDGWVDIEFRVLDDVRENYITIVHEIGHSLGLAHPNGNGFNSNYDIQDTIMSYNDNPSLEDIWFSDADIYTLQRIYGLEEVNNNNGSASFSISGTAVVGNTLSISEDYADPDGTGTLSYIWQISSDENNWSVAGTNSTYIVGVSEEGKSIRAVLSYMDAQGFNEVVTTNISSIPFVDDGSASFSISGTAVVKKISIAKNLTDFEALSYIASYGDLINAFGTDLTSANYHYTNFGKLEGRSLTTFNANNYLAKYSDLSAAFGSDQTLALKHYIEFGYAEGRTDTFTSSVSGSDSSSNLTDFEALNYIASYGDLINVFGNDSTSAKFHYTYYGKSKELTLDDFDEWGYLASNNDLINSLGSDTTEAVKHYISFGYSQGKSTNLFNAQSYLNNYADLRDVFGDNQELATKHYVEYGFNEGRVF